MKFIISKKIRFIFFIFFILFSSNNAYAYLDPGSASLLLQIIAGVLSSALIFLNSVNNFIKYILNKKLFSSVLIITLSILTHYVPLVYLFLKYGTNFRIHELFIYLILMNLYLIYLKKKNLCVNKIYNYVYLKNELI